MAYRSPKTGRFISLAAWNRWYAPDSPGQRAKAQPSEPTFVDEGYAVGREGIEFEAGDIWEESFGDEGEGWDDVPYFDYDDFFADEVLDSDSDQYVED